MTSSSGTPSGSVSLLDGTAVLATQTLSGGTASFTVSKLAAGQHSLTATYSGDATFAASTSTAALAIAVTDVAVTLSSSTQTVASGASATYTVNLGAVANFNGTVTLACSGLPAGYSCASSTTTLSGSNATASLVVSPTKAALNQPGLPGPGALSIACASVLLLWLVPSRRSVARLLSVVGVACLLGIAGCSGGSGNTTTPPQTSTFTITATLTQGTQTTTHSTTATLIVQ